MKSCGSERREGIRVRSTASPFARRVEGGPWDTRRAGATPGLPAVALSDKGARSRSEQASRASCRSLVGSERPVERELDSQPGNRFSTARGPLEGRHRRFKTAGVRGNASLPGVLDLHVGCRRRRLVFSDHTAAEGAPDRRRPAPFMRSGGKRSERSVRRESVRAGRGRKNRVAVRTLTIRSG